MMDGPHSPVNGGADVIRFEHALKGASAGSGLTCLTRDPQSALALAEALAASRAEHPRIVLVKRLSDLLLLSTDQVLPSERALIDEILVRLLAHVDLELRARIAQRICGMSEPPREVLVMLAHDDPTVAAPILENSTAITDSDLIDVVRRGSSEHRRLIATRKQISSAVTDALIEMSENAVLETLTANPGAVFSMRGLYLLAQRSRRVPGLGSLLVEREDLHPTLAYAMFWWLPSSLRVRILFRFTISRRVLQQAIADAVAQGDFDPESMDPMEREALEFVHGRLYAARGRVTQVFEQLRKGETEQFLSGFAIAAGISRQTVVKILRDEGGEALAVLCKAVSLARDDFGTLVRLLVRARGKEELPASRLEELQVVFDTLPIDSADLALRYWDRPRLGEGHGAACETPRLT